MNISQYRLAKEIHVPARRINEIVLEKRAVSADTALRLGSFCGTTAQFWSKLQAQYDLEVARDAIEDLWSRKSPRSIRRRECDKLH